MEGEEELDFDVFADAIVERDRYVYCVVCCVRVQKGWKYHRLGLVQIALQTQVDLSFWKNLKKRKSRDLAVRYIQLQKDEKINK